MRLALSLGLLFAGCRGPSGVPAPSSEVPTPPVASSTASATEIPGAAPAVSATRPGDGCWGIGLPTEPVARLAKLGERCAEGAHAVFAEPRKLEGDVAELALPTLAAGSCVRVAAVAGATVDLVLVAHDGVELAVDRDAAFSLAPAKGPLCPRGAVTARLKRAAPGPVWVQAWATK